MLWSHACLLTLLSSWILFIVLPKLAFLCELLNYQKRKNLKKPFPSRVLLPFLTSWIYLFSYEHWLNSIPVLPLSQNLCIGLSSHCYKGQSYRIISSLSSYLTNEAILSFWQLVLCSQSLRTYKSGCVMDSKTWKRSEESYPKEPLSVKILSYKTESDYG